MSDPLDVSAVLWDESHFDGWRVRGNEHPRQRLIANPGSDDIRQLLPWRPSSILATGRRSSDERPIRRVLRDSIGVAALLTGGALDKSRRVGISARSSLVGHVASVLGFRKAYGIVLCGPPRANQKPVVQVHDGLGRTLAYVKVSWNALTHQLLDDEHTALTHLGGIADKGFSVPEVLAGGTYGDAGWLALGPVAVDRRVRPDSQRLDALAVAIERTAPAWEGRAGDADYINGLVADAAGHEHSEWAVESLIDRWSQHTIQLGASHGDFVPWNMLSGTPEPAVWDWERYRTAVPTGFDRLHLRVQTSTHRDRLPLDDALRRLAQQLDEVLSDLPHAQRQARFDWYIADLLCRYERDVPDHPTRLPERISHLTIVLKERLTAK